MSEQQTAEETKIEDMDDYNKAAQYLIAKALEDGAFMLRAVKTLMDAVTPGE